MKRVFQTLSLPRHGFAAMVAAIILSATSVVAEAAVCTTQRSGNWNTRNTWSCNHVPNNTDTVVIAHNVTLSTSTTIAGITINAGITLTASNNRDLTVTGNIINDGTYAGNGRRIYMTRAGATISGNGTFDNTRIYIDADNITLSAGSTLNFSAGANLRVGRNQNASLTIAGTITDTGQPAGSRILRLDNNNRAAVNITGTLNTPNSFVEIQQGGTLTNNGVANIQYLDGNGDSNVTWTQGANSSLTMSQPAQGWNRATLNASATGNTVTYNGTSTPLTPSGSTYFNLAGTYFNAPGSCPHGFTVLGSDPCTTTPGSGSTTGSPTLCVNDTTIGTYAWDPTRLNNVGASDNQYAQANGRNSSITNYLKCTGYNFNIPADAVIDGIELNVEGRSSRTFFDYAVNLVKANTIQTVTNYANGNAFRSNNDLTFTYGTPTDLWGSAWLPTDINSTTFGVAFAAQRGPYNTTDTIRIDHIPITVHYHIPSTPIAYYAMDEMVWNGNSGEVIDSSTNGLHGTALAGLNTTPAKVCQGANFNGANGPVQVADNALLDLTNQLTASAWIKPNKLPASDLMSILSKDTNYEFHINPAGEIYWWWKDSNNNTGILTTTGANITPGNWYHVAITYRSGQQRIYVNGVQLANSSYTGNLITNNNPLQIGGDQGITNRLFNGFIDEVRIYDGAQTVSSILTDMNSTHPCPSQVHHYRIVHDGSGLTCNPETVTVQACMDTACNSFYTGVVSGTLSPSSKAFSITDGSGRVPVAFRNNSAGTITLGITGASPVASNATTCLMDDGVITSASCDMTFYDTGFVFDVPNLTSCKTSTGVTISAVSTDPTTQQCVPAFKNRNETLKFWSSYVSPTSGTQSVAVNGTNVATASPGTDVTLNFDANGQSTITVAYPDAGDMQLNASYTGATGTADAGLVMTGNDPFVAVPAKLIVNSGDTNAACATGDATCSIFKKAGEAFNLTVSAACADNTVTQNFAANGITLSHKVVAPAGIDGTLGQGTVDITTNGSATLSNQSISEVGVFTISASLDKYRGISTATGTPLIEGISSNIGRFIPARLIISANTPVLANSCAVSANPYTYLDQDFGFSTNPILTVTAQNTSGTFTQNYGDTFWKLGTTLANRSYADAVGTTGFTPTISTTLPTLAEANNFDNVPPTITINNDTLKYVRPVAPVSAFASNVDLTITAADLTDSDGVCYDAAAGTICNTKDGVGTPTDLTIAGITGASLRYGVGIASDALNPATAIGTTITLPITAQYFDAAGAVATNVDDSCSPVSYTKADTGITTTTAPALAPATETLTTGSGDLTVTLTGDIGGDIGGYTVYTLTWPVYLPGPTSATAIFGAVPSDNNYLYWNEN